MLFRQIPYIATTSLKNCPILTRKDLARQVLETCNLFYSVLYEKFAFPGPEVLKMTQDSVKSQL